MVGFIVVLIFVIGLVVIAAGSAPEPDAEPDPESSVQLLASEIEEDPPSGGGGSSSVKGSVELYACEDFVLFVYVLHFNCPRLDPRVSQLIKQFPKCAKEVVQSNQLTFDELAGNNVGLHDELLRTRFLPGGFFSEDMPIGSIVGRIDMTFTLAKEEEVRVSRSEGRSDPKSPAPKRKTKPKPTLDQIVEQRIDSKVQRIVAVAKATSNLSARYKDQVSNDSELQGALDRILEMEKMSIVDEESDPEPRHRDDMFPSDDS